ncbi:melanoma-associated antigen 4-like [Ursus arctos]|uniref:melanoma-associated antigen 4-like n=1 Tax=Ursus arctos TaxID=9644 RepID=UPI002017656A|nr:melanoma-associated antigen 4-like [Ursus arctos]
MASVQLVTRNLRGDSSQTPLSASLLRKWWGGCETGCEAERLQPCLPESRGPLPKGSGSDELRLPPQSSESGDDLRVREAGSWSAEARHAATAWGQPHHGSSSPDEEGSSGWEEPEEAQPLLQDTLQGKAADLVAFLVLKYLTQQRTSQAEMLEVVGNDYQDAFPVIFGQASECMRLVFGVDVKEVDPSDHSYVLVTVLGLTCGGLPSGEQGMPKTGLLVVLLGVIVLEGDCAPEEKVWEVLGVMGVYASREHVIYGEPRELLTNVWVQEGYVEYRQVPGSDPARYEFLCGPRAYAETSKFQVLEYLLRVSRGQQPSSLALCEESVSDEEEGA